MVPVPHGGREGGGDLERVVLGGGEIGDHVERAVVEGGGLDGAGHGPFYGEGSAGRRWRGRRWRGWATLAWLLKVLVSSGCMREVAADGNRAAAVSAAAACCILARIGKLPGTAFAVSPVCSSDRRVRQVEVADVTGAGTQPGKVKHTRTRDRPGLCRRRQLPPNRRPLVHRADDGSHASQHDLPEAWRFNENRVASGA